MRRGPTSLLVATLLVAAQSCAPPPARDRAALLVEKGQSAEAAQLLRDHLAQHPDAIPERRMLVRVLALLGDLGGAEREAEALARRMGDASPVPWIELGHAYELGHRYDSALSMYDHAAEVAPTDAAGPREGGLRAARWGELELAEPRLREAVRRDPDDARTWHALGLVRLRLGDVDGARQAYAHGLEADPRALENRIGLATAALVADDPAAALREYDAILAAKPNFADAELGRSYALLRLGRLDEAAAALDRGERAGADPAAVKAQRAEIAARRSATPPRPPPAAAAPTKSP